MKTQETIIKILSKETKTGNTNGQDWSITEYTVLETIEMENGSMLETKVKASAAKSLGELDVGGIYKAVMFITSRESEKDGKKVLWNSFRITRAEKIGGEDPKAQAEQTVEAIADDIPFNEVP